MFLTTKDFIAAAIVLCTITIGGYLYTSGAFSGQNAVLNGVSPVEKKQETHVK